MAVASIADIEAAVAGTTAPSRFADLVRDHPDLPMLRGMKSGRAGEWQTWTARDVAGLAARTAAGLRAAGVGPGDRVLLMMRNRPEFHWLDIAAQLLRATPISIYNSSSAAEIAYLAGHAGAVVAVVEDAVFLDRLSKAAGDLPALRHVFVVEPPTGGCPDGVAPAASLLEHGSLPFEELAAAVEPADVATLIYTSGTTGPPKGVMVSQHNVVYTVESLLRCLADEHALGRRVVSYLPMAHIAERMASHYEAMVVGLSVHPCPDQSQVAGYFKEVRPEYLFGVPRVWEKVYATVNAVLAADPEKKAQFDDGVRAALEIRAAERAGTVTQEQRDTWAFLDAVAFSLVREQIGLDAVVCAVSGAAAIPRHVIEWFDAIGVPLSEIYGMSESSGPMTWSPLANRPGYVGREIPGCEVRLAPDGEVICRGGNVFAGYFADPDKTADTVVDGWLHSGDIGELDADGYLRIVDRKKELIITTGGKNISPANLELALKTIPLVGQAAAIGDGRKFCTAILVLDPDTAAVWAKAHGRDGASLAQLAADAEVLAEVGAGVDAANRQFSQAEQIKKFVLVGEEWLPDSDVLTPTSKLKRRGVDARYADEIERMYAGA